VGSLERVGLVCRLDRPPDRVVSEGALALRVVVEHKSGHVASVLARPVPGIGATP
jgi:hypothetical protein